MKNGFFEQMGKREIMRLAQREHQAFENATRLIAYLRVELYCANQTHEHFKDADEKILAVLRAELEKRQAKAEK